MSNRYFGDSELAHHGILGQRWGIRRFQNADGTLTDEGRRRRMNALQGSLRYDDQGNLTSASQLAVDKAMNNQFTMNELDRIKGEYGQLYNGSAQGINAAANIANTSTNLINPERYKEDLEQMTNKEIQDYVSRMNLENQYTRLRSERDDYKLNKGREDVVNTLRVAGNVVLVAGSIAGTIMTIQTLQSGALPTK